MVERDVEVVRVVGSNPADPATAEAIFMAVAVKMKLNGAA